MATATAQIKGNSLKSIVSKYKKGAGLAALATEFEYPIPAIRQALVEADVTIRGRGRPCKA